MGEWIKTIDRLPGYDQYVLWCCDSGYMFCGMIDKDGSFDDLNKPFIEFSGGVTHWMPLPEPPKD